jgi:predicted phosphohydrolase
MTIFLARESSGRSPVMDTPSALGKHERIAVIRQRGEITAFISMLHLPPWYTPGGTSRATKLCTAHAKTRTLQGKLRRSLTGGGSGGQRRR